MTNEKTDNKVEYVRALNNNELNVLLQEYGKAQDSAEHSDSLIWTSTSIIWGGELLLISYLVTSFQVSHWNRTRVLLTLAAVFATLLLWVGRRIVLIWNSTMNQKYNRCKKIEDLLGMKQHSKLDSQEDAQKTLYLAVTVCLTVFWAVYVSVLWCCQ